MFKRGDIVEWIENSRTSMGLHSVGIVTSHDTSGVDVFWLYMNPELAQMSQAQGDHWERCGWSVEIFKKIGELPNFTLDNLHPILLDSTHREKREDSRSRIPHD